ncbi:glycosyltransferase family 2 protein [Terrisporobacter glycolicus]|uniref:Glycosyltransferase EpsH n=1 Tax=Terrisporobacter glycolicus ATCC 14880 = DSM 1288 TaxID=1121315 RepID=A0ABZ2EUZ2_9FIRM|nr:glycosyltransferase [Terrisporobacter glycolicus]
MFKQAKPTISIILPVHNTSSYLEECLNSIHNQSFKNYELICVDDGSLDNSYEILKKYEKIITNCKVIRQSNQGVASARNEGLRNVSGDYIVFIDSDDFIEYNYLERLYNESCNTNADVVICNFYRYYDNSKLKLPVVCKKSSGVYSSYNILKSLIPDNLIHSYLWNKLWKKELFENINFPSIKYEDISIMCDLFYKAKKVSIISDTLYYYRIRKTSIVRNYSISTQNDYVKAYGFIRLFLKEKNIYDKFKFSFALLSIKVFFVMFFINIFLISEYKSLKITFENFASFYNFISCANSSSYNYSTEQIMNLEVLQSSN